jgi:hypothetical protein
VGDAVGGHGTRPSYLELGGVDRPSKELVECLIAGEDDRLVYALDDSAKIDTESQRE